MEHPQTIHDFGGFPRPLHEIEYPADGDSALAARVKQLIASAEVIEDISEWGLDHGTWSVLRHVYPKADIPVVQMSLDARQPPSYHYELAEHLAPLRDEGILVMGTGNVVHNLQTVLRADEAAPFDWALRFSAKIRAHIVDNDHAALVDADLKGADASMSVPTPEHYLPLLYVIALRRPDDGIAFLTEGIELGSIDMMSVVIGSELSAVR